MVKNPPSNADSMLPLQGVWVQSLVEELRSHMAAGQLSLCTTTAELVCLRERACMPQTVEPMHSGAHAPQLQSPRALEPTGHN